MNDEQYEVVKWLVARQLKVSAEHHPIINRDRHTTYFSSGREPHDTVNISTTFTIEGDSHPCKDCGKAHYQVTGQHVRVRFYWHNEEFQICAIDNGNQYSSVNTIKKAFAAITKATRRKKKHADV